MKQLEKLQWERLVRVWFIPFLLACRLVFPLFSTHVLSGQVLTEALPAQICADVEAGKLFPEVSSDADCTVSLAKRAENGRVLWMEGSLHTGAAAQELTVILRKLPGDRYRYDRSRCYPGAGWERIEWNEALWTETLTIEGNAVSARVQPRILLILTAVIMEGWMLYGPLLARLRHRREDQ